MNDACRDIIDRYVLAMDRDIDPAFAAARAANPGVIPCGRGCALCCAGMFAINAIDAALLRLGLAAATEEASAAVALRAGDLMCRVAEAAPAAVRVPPQAPADSASNAWSAPWRIEDFGWPEFARLAARLDSRCPVLGAGDECLLYDHRPRIARLQGVSWFDPETGDTLRDFCAEIFGDPDYARLRPQPMPLTGNTAEAVLLLDEWRSLTGRSGHTFVAAALTTPWWDP
jgi:hypothetical protein